jgi:hypothetical protein
MVLKSKNDSKVKFYRNGLGDAQQEFLGRTKLEILLLNKK